jgi:hypothetical protein
METEVSIKQDTGSFSTITDLRPALGVEDLLRGQGIDPQRAPDRIRAVTEGLLDEVHSLIAPAAIYTILPVSELEHERVVLQNGQAFSGPLATRALAGATYVALAVCTAGPALDARVNELFAAGDTLRALALDGAGNAAVGGVAQLLSSVLCDEATARGLRVGMRASPGQEGWPITEQRVLFGLLPGEPIGVRLSPTCLMEPRKSVSFAVGMGPEMREDAVPCDFCTKRSRCHWHRESPAASAGSPA